MQLGVTLTSLAIGALGEHALTKVVRPGARHRARGHPRVPHPHVPPRRDRRARAEGGRARYSERTALAVSTPVRIFFVVCAADLAAPALDGVAAAGVRPAGAGRRGSRALGGRAEDARQRVDRARRDRGGRAGDALQGLRLRRQGGLRRDGAAARGGRALGRPPAGGGAPGGARVAVHALPGLPRLARRDRRRAARARPDRGDARARDRDRPGRGLGASRVHGSRDEGSRRAPHRVPAPNQHMAIVSTSTAPWRGS